MSKKQYRTKGRYMNQTRWYNGKLYDSIAEANHAEELDKRIVDEEIVDVKHQHKIDLRVNGRHICNYYIDFRVVCNDGTVEFHEVKGVVSPMWQMKWALLEALVEEIEPGARLILIK